MHDYLDKRTHRGLIIKLHHDQDCESPRENDNLGTIIAWHRNYRLSDDDAPKGLDPADFKPADYAVCLPIYMYEHSGVMLKAADANPFSCPWDSGQVGYIYVTREKMLSDALAKKATKKVVANAISVLKSEVDEYSKYVNGECYGYTVETDEGEEVDACWGFIGDEYAWEAAIEAADYEADARLARADALTDAQRSEN